MRIAEYALMMYILLLNFPLMNMVLIHNVGCPLKQISPQAHPLEFVPLFVFQIL